MDDEEFKNMENYRETKERWQGLYVIMYATKDEKGILK